MMIHVVVYLVYKNYKERFVHKHVYIRFSLNVLEIEACIHNDQ